MKLDACFITTLKRGTSRGCTSEFPKTGDPSPRCRRKCLLPGMPEGLLKAASGRAALVSLR